jgi:predicted TIM-barrel fold metal-dependent hydrolase
MLCDSHCHLKHGDRAMTEYTPDRIVDVMDEADIDKTVVFAMSTTSSRATEFAHNAVKAFPDRLIPYAYAIPHMETSTIREVERAVSELGFPGIKVHGGETKLVPHIADPIFALAEKLEVPCLVDFIGNVDHTRRILEDFPQTQIIIAHLGKYLCTDRNLVDRFIELAEKHENATLDISGVVLPWKITEAVARVGSDRVTFGIDGPHPYPTLAGYAQAEIAKVNALGLSEVDRENLFWNTIARLLKFE